jgi:hypothetical protein
MMLPTNEGEIYTYLPHLRHAIITQIEIGLSMGIPPENIAGFLYRMTYKLVDGKPLRGKTRQSAS